MTKVRLTGDLQHDGQSYLKGTVFEGSKKLTDELIALGVAADPDLFEQQAQAGPQADAGAEADKIKADAEKEATATRKAAQDEATKLVADAKAEAAKLLDEARQGAKVKVKPDNAQDEATQADNPTKQTPAK